jgi:hypothetical protein
VICATAGSKCAKGEINSDVIKGPFMCGWVGRRTNAYWLLFPVFPVSPVRAGGREMKRVGWGSGMTAAVTSWGIVGE